MHIAPNAMGIASSNTRKGGVGLRADLFILFSLTIGRYPVPLRQILHVILTTPLTARFDYTDAYRVVVEIVRLPRVLLVTLRGMGLALSGATIQGYLT